MLLDHASGGVSEGALSLKTMLSQKIDDQIKTQHFEDAIKELLSNKAESEASNTSEGASSSSKVEEVRKMLESVLIHTVNINEVPAQKSLFEDVYKVMHSDSLFLPLFLLKTSDLDHNQARINANLVLHLSNIIKCHASKDSEIGVVMNEFESSHNLPPKVLLANLDSM
mmetsp:Transcript_34310/g.39641  ORF Transcript_34310/g.39641 Transcript_34310/m.39641 type:complete len:169 (-) Transcript_34310:1409-1915(-)